MVITLTFVWMFCLGLVALIRGICQLFNLAPSPIVTGVLALLLAVGGGALLIAAFVGH